MADSGGPEMIGPDSRGVGQPPGGWRLRRRTLLAASLAAAGAGIATFTAPPGVAASAYRDELLDYDGVGLAQLIRTGQVSAREVLEASIRRIEALDGQIAAMTTLTFQRARERAERIAPDSVFAGVPMVFKDLVDVGGVRRTSGSRLHLSHVPEGSVEYVKAVERAGLNLVGMTNTSEFASIALTDNQVFGPTRNPWSLARSAGGSSGGSAAAVAAGYVPIAHGTDGGGSNRIPAACCGLLGMKASRYRQKSGESDGGHLFLRTHQVITRSVRDSAALLAATEDPGNRAGYPPVGLVHRPPDRGLRIALTSENCFREQPLPSVKDVVQKTAMLCEALGHEVTEVSYPVSGPEMIQAFEGIMLARLPHLLSAVEALTGRRAEDAGILTPALVDLGRYAQTLPDDAYEAGIAYFDRIAGQFRDFWSEFDLWLTPTMPLEVPEVGYVGPETAWETSRKRNWHLMSYTAIANGLGAPAMSVPLFHSGETGLPVGSHFIAAPGADRLLYEMAFALETAQPWAGRWAPQSARFPGALPMSTEESSRDD